MPSDHRINYMREWNLNNRDRRQKYNSEFFKKRKIAFEKGDEKRATHGKCSLCKTVKTADQFYLSNTNKSGLHGWCKPCSDRKTVENGRKRIHGITPKLYAHMLDLQDNRCAICRVDELGSGKKSFCVDHDHKTMKVRGILCTKCNTMIGVALDDVEILRSAIAYLEREK